MTFKSSCVWSVKGVRW